MARSIERSFRGFFQFDNSAATTGITDLILVMGDLSEVPSPGPPCSSCTMAPQPFEGTYLAANTGGMASEPEPPKPRSWNIYKVAKKATWLGTVEAPDAATAIEKAAAEFKVDTWRLLAVTRR
jgi:hypothetical protein